MRLGCGGVVEGIEALVLDVGNGEQVGANAYSACRKHLKGDSTRHAQGRGETAREVPAARDVLVAVPLHPCGEVCVAGTRHLEEVGIVARARVGVLDHGGEGCSAGSAMDVQAAHDAGAVLLAAGRGPAPLVGGPAGHERGKGILVNNDARGQALDYAANGGGV